MMEYLQLNEENMKFFIFQIINNYRTNKRIYDIKNYIIGLSYILRREALPKIILEQASQIL